MRSDLERIKKMIDVFRDNEDTLINDPLSLVCAREAIHRELLTSWQAMNAAEYQTDAKLHLNMLTKRMLEGEKQDIKNEE